MKQIFVGDIGSNDKLILVFAGWGMDERVFSRLSFAGYDMMVVWDYRNADLDLSALGAYREIYLFAWSFGVFAASLKMKELERFRIMLRVAINGSVTPVDDLTGIPEAIFQGTLNGLDERNLAKFYRRMCFDAQEYKRFVEMAPQRDIAELKSELRAIYDMSRDESVNVSPLAWDRAVISDGDRIFPSDNLVRSWMSLSRVRHIPGGHLPDFSKIIEQEIIDKELGAARFAGSAATYDGAAEIQSAMAEKLWRLVEPRIPGSAESLLEIGYGTGLLTKLYCRRLSGARITLWDLAPQKLEIEAETVKGDAEAMIADVGDRTVDIILSAATVQWFNNLPRFISIAATKLKRGGIMAISTFGPQNMAEITELTKMPLRYYTLEELKGMVPKSCATIVAEEEKAVMEFKSPREVMMHLRNTGVNALKHVDLGYASMAGGYPRVDGMCRLTYHPQYIIIKRKDDE